MTEDAEVVTREIEVPAGADEVWEALVDDERRAEWFGGETELDPRPGGRGFVTDEDGTRRDVLVHEVEPGRRLSFDWWTETEVPSHVEFVVVPSESGSRLVVTERPLLPSAPMCGSTVRGATGSSWCRLVGYLSAATV